MVAAGTDPAGCAVDVPEVRAVLDAGSDVGAAAATGTDGALLGILVLRSTCGATSSSSERLAPA